MPIADHVSGVCEKRIIGMHNAFRRARGAGGKREIAHFIGIFVALGQVVFEPSGGGK